jgi:hypothetical protein
VVNCEPVTSYVELWSTLPTAVVKGIPVKEIFTVPVIDTVF